MNYSLSKRAEIVLSEYFATSTESKGVKIDGFLYPNFM
jgi:hypothetical protein